MRKYFLLTLAVLGCAGAQVETGKNVYAVPKKDAMTDANQGKIVIREINDASGSTFIFLRCMGQGNFDMYLMTKNPLMSEADYEEDATPDVMYRIDSQAAKTLPTLGVTNHDKPDLNSLTFTDNDDLVLHNAFIAANKITVRILRNGMSNLDYVFPAKGYIAAWNKINRCK